MKTDFLGRRRPSSLYAIAKNVVVHEVSSPATTTSPSVVWVVEAQDVPPLGIAGPVVSAIVCSEAVTDLWDRHLTDGGEASSGRFQRGDSRAGICADVEVARTVGGGGQGFTTGELESAELLAIIGVKQRGRAVVGAAG